MLEENKGGETKYQKLVRKLIYPSHTRPDIAYLDSMVSQFMHNPTNKHFQVVNRIIQYLKVSLGRGFLLKKRGETIYIDYARLIVTRVPPQDI
uniref:Retrovirus-related Pol polyprotein from transposon TNT 1-94 n=1 Tax=Cajanus cajan TaxID=3821 RepID=A0A151UAP5_CAJCA|nr:hypothetical protein KK1_020636 [Cajanus cajan]